MVNFNNLMETLSMKIRPFGPASDKPSDCFGFCGRLQLFVKVVQIKMIPAVYPKQEFF